MSREAGPLTLAAARTQVAIKVDYRGQILSLEQTDLGERTDLVIRGRRGGVKARISLGIRELDELLVAAGAARGRALAQRQNLEILERRDYEIAAWETTRKEVGDVRGHGHRRLG